MFVRVCVDHPVFGVCVLWPVCHRAAFWKNGPEKEEEPREVQADGLEEPRSRFPTCRGLCAFALFVLVSLANCVCVGKSHESVCDLCLYSLHVSLTIFVMFRAQSIAIQHMRINLCFVEWTCLSVLRRMMEYLRAYVWFHF